MITRWFRSMFAPVVSLAAIGVLVGCEEEQAAVEAQPRPVAAIEVGATAGFYGRWFPGRARAAREVEVAFNVSGPVLALPAKVGDRVEEGQLLASIDTAPYQVEVARQEANLARAEAGLAKADQDLGRDQTLYEQGNIAKARFDTTFANQRAARAEVSAFNAALEGARLNLQDCFLEAPFAGIVVALYVDEFQNVRASERILRLVDPRQIEMVVDIPEVVISVVPHARNIVVVFDNFDEIIYPAEIKEIGAEASQTTRTYPITLLVGQIDEVEILPGMTGRASGEGDRDAAGIAEALVVPIAAVFSPEDLETTFVWVINEADMTVTRRPVKVGQVTDGGIEILDGLSDGEWIAIAGVNYLVEGQEVRILES